MVTTNATKILIIDDNEDEVLLMRRVLLRINPEIELTVAYNGEQGVNVLQECEVLPSLVLLDLKMPGMGGINFLHRLRSNNRLKSLPVIVVTNSTLETDKRDSFEAGASDFLRKSCNMDQFQGDLAIALNRQLKN